MCWDCYNNDKGDPYKNFRHGAVEVEDFEEVIPYRHPPRKHKEKKRRGCPGNDYKAHVYVWTTEFEPVGKFRYPWSGRVLNSFYEENGFHQYERKVCVGCGRKAGYRHTAEMIDALNKGKSTLGKRWYWYGG